MTIKKAIILLLALMLMITSTAFAALSTEGRSDGGALGTCRCEGNLNLKNGSRDYAIATTKTGAVGKLSALARIYWSNGTTTVSRSNDGTLQSGTTLPVTVYADNEYGIRANGGHAYTSTDYGTWYGTTNGNY